MATCTELETPAAATTLKERDYHITLQQQVSTEEYLIYLTKTVIDICNSRMYDHPFVRTRLAPTIRTELNGKLGIGPESCINNYKAVADASPAFHTEIFNESAVVDERKGVATVLLSQDMTEHVRNRGRMCGAVSYTWQWTDDGWICKSCSMMYGTAEFLAV